MAIAKHPIVFVLSILVLALVGCERKKTTTEKLTPVPARDSIVEIVEIIDAPSDKVTIVPTMSSTFPDSNTVYCSNIGYLWDALASSADKNISDNPLAKLFSENKSWRNSMDTAQLILAFGEPQQVFKSLTRQYKTKYGITKDDLTPQGSSFWGYTDKSVNFTYAEAFEEQPLMFLGTKVSAFGFNSGFSSSYTKEHFKDQFEILYFDYDEFVVQLKPANTTDEIIIAMLHNRGTFLNMFNTVNRLIKKGKAIMKKDAQVYTLNADDELVIPAIRFKASRSYPEVQGLNFSSKYAPIESFDQVINFNFNRRGVIMDAMVDVADSIGAPQKPKLLRFEKPFYVYIKEAKASHPYFNLWVSAPSILEEKKRSR